MQQSSAAAACRSWSPPLPIDTAPVLALLPLEQPLLEHVLPPSASSSVPGSSYPTSETKEVASPRPSGKRPTALTVPGQPRGRSQFQPSPAPQPCVPGPRADSTASRSPPSPTCTCGVTAVPNSICSRS